MSVKIGRNDPARSSKVQKLEEMIHVHAEAEKNTKHAIRHLMSASQ